MEKQLLEDIVHLLQDVEWLYNFPVTQIFTRNILSQMPVEWRDALTEIPLEVLNGIPQHKYQEHWPSTLKSFLEECSRLSLHQLVNDHYKQPAVDTNQSLKLPQELTRRMTMKKRHEVISLLGLVKRLSEISENCHVLDIGSGIGYMDTLLHRVLKLIVIGAESEDKLVTSANTRQQELQGRCSGIRYLNWTLADDELTLQKSKEVISELIQLDPVCTCQFRNHMNKKPVFSMNGESEIDTSLTGNDKEKEVACTDDSHPKTSAILLGLHACADLSPIMMKIFKDSSHLSTLILLSCCYHKMKLITGNMKKHNNDIDPTVNNENLCCNICGDSEGLELIGNNENQLKELYSEETMKICDNDGENFVNFPMSKTLEDILQHSDVHMTPFGMRLAAQESGLRWIKQTDDDHENHKKNVAYRALLEVFCFREGYKLKKLRRRCVRKSRFTNFSEYIESVIENYEFQPTKGNVFFTSSDENRRSSEEIGLVIKKTNDGNRKDDKNVSDAMPSSREPTLSQEYITNALQKCHEDYQYLFPLIEPFTGLQLALQPVMEALILVDRLAYLNECGITRVWLEKVFDVEISPRNVALIAVRFASYEPFIKPTNSEMTFTRFHLSTLQEK